MSSVFEKSVKVNQGIEKQIKRLLSKATEDLFVFNFSNLMKICVESMFSLPESWNANGMQYTYAACLPMPVSDKVR